MSATRVLIIRHGQSTWNAAGRWQGHADAPLTELGQQQATLAAAALPAAFPGVAAIWASDLQRARTTADIIGRTVGLRVRVDARFRERHAGDWTGLTRHEIEAGWPRYLAEHKRPAGFEHDEAVLERILAGLADIVTDHRDDDVLVVAHGGVLRALERHCQNVDRAFPNLGGRRFDLGGDGADLNVSAGERVMLLAEDQATYTHAP